MVVGTELCDADGVKESVKLGARLNKALGATLELTLGTEL